ncbi:zf-HC2 domain-containing protein [Streptomyces polyrhachis]|uniref:Zf-HC2 domain-containing protein n=1 Tax=Streptomyces polyrhachis TaxID=1282885 RepID=A0ABW2GEN7_9ACTN
MSGHDGPAHTDVGAYALGLLTGEEADRYEAHLAGCAPCAAELESLLGTAGVLAELGPGAPEFEPAPPAVLRRALDADGARRRTARRRGLALVCAAGVLVVGGPLATGLLLGGGEARTGPPRARTTATAAPTPPTPSTATDSARLLFEHGGLPRATATDPATGVTATVATAAGPWGTSAVLELRHVTGPRTCALIAVGRDGREETLATWSVPAGGYGTGPGTEPGARPGPRPGSQDAAALYVQGGAGLAPERIARFLVRTPEGKVLVSVPMPPR